MVACHAAAVREALADASADVEVAAVGVDGQMHGVVLAGDDGNAVRPGILWLDRRAEAEAARYGELPAELTRPLGNQASAGMAGPMLGWLAAHEPDVATGGPVGVAAEGLAADAAHRPGRHRSD